ncbi:MAG TPA: prepilin-type cleavage/methylation domain-containing protein [Verrucomicrobiales bacterium]|nr:prepilin-type cleavage/methylation domain-containing protein [Verrucomicrobiales bacterium]
MKIHSKSGFTLVEIMIVVAIIGVLAAIAIPNLVKARKDAQRAACVQNLRAIEGAKEVWALDTRKGGNEGPQPTELYGSDKAIKSEPHCPAGGTYTIGTMDSKPTCSVTDHVLPN